MAQLLQSTVTLRPKNINTHKNQVPTTGYWGDQDVSGAVEEDGMLEQGWLRGQSVGTPGKEFRLHPNTTRSPEHRKEGNKEQNKDRNKEGNKEGSRQVMK